ncbi:acidic leucine-rich nuclear phosphoprotein 32 family member B-like [Helianthus annuus]|uniref:acidic leucine-rich nuclear phosphoprotein 32 family member B-like n=1 Tax=Helianthus annuus TaxID=4232 RepID=UPI000B8F6093|nr:acidic leucine-rich nuclear phosphoprotein 32 family member B-like [Helianthus annuus]
MVAEVKTKMKEEILQEKTYRERYFANYRIEEMRKEYEEARSYVIPLPGEYYSKIEVDKDSLEKLDKIIRDVMTLSLKKRDEERMKKNVEKMVDELKKTAGKDDSEDEQKNEEVKEKEATGEESQKTTEEDVAEKHQDDESSRKKEEETGGENQEKVDEKLEK